MPKNSPRTVRLKTCWYDWPLEEFDSPDRIAVDGSYEAWSQQKKVRAPLKPTPGKPPAVGRIAVRPAVMR